MDFQRTFRCLADLANAHTVALQKVDDFLGVIGGLCCRCRYAIKKEVTPAFPIALEPHILQQILIKLAVFFEMQAEIQDRLHQHAVGAQQKCDQQTPQTAIASALARNAHK